MATRAATNPTSQLHPYALVTEWAGLQATDTGSWALLGHYNDKCLHVYGTFDGAVVTIEGSNEDTPSSAIGLTDPTQTAISLTAAGMKQVLENPLYIRVKVAGGGGSTALTARLVCRQ